MRKFFEMNDTDVLVVVILYFVGVIGLGIYCIGKWKKEDEDKE